MGLVGSGSLYRLLPFVLTTRSHVIVFHRNIKNFMIQGGDPTGTGKGGQSYWKKDFEDEIKGALKHDSRGILSMANRGAGTNSSQFFITYKPTSHLDGKHTVFGKVVGGLEVLTRLEEVPTQEKTDRPLKPIKIEEIDVVVDPFEGWKEAQKRAAEDKVKEAQREEKANKEMEANRKAREAREARQRRIEAGEELPEDLAADTSSAPVAVGKYLKAAGDGSTLVPVVAATGQKRESTSLWDADDDFFTKLSAGNAGAPPPKKAKSGGYGDFSSF
jgi:peptidyl-prolyl cis-trans isomerase-like protein 2